MLKKISLIALLFLPVAIWVFLKPVRVLIPEAAGVSCVTERICIDEKANYPKALELYENAFQFVVSHAGEIKNKPRIIFCSTDHCFQAFGLGKRTSATIGTIAIVISRRGWESHYVRHEIIHHLQKERLGNLRTWFITPDWFKEGMAYSLSEDPRTKLSEPFDQYRKQFQDWYKLVGKDRLWEKARDL